MSPTRNGESSQAFAQCVGTLAAAHLVVFVATGGLAFGLSEGAGAPAWLSFTVRVLGAPLFALPFDALAVTAERWFADWPPVLVGGVAIVAVVGNSLLWGYLLARGRAVLRRRMVS